MKQIKYTNDEIQTASWYFAMTNMALYSPKIDDELRASKSWQEKTDRIKQHCFRMFEGEMEVDGMKEEVNSWVKDFKKGNKFCINEWEIYKKKLGI